MTRAVLEALVLFLSPFFLFMVYLYLRQQSPWSKEAWDGHISWLVCAGLLVAIAGFIVTGMKAERNMGGYVPTRFEDGRLVPGHFQ